ncbi:hypothetical protein ACS0TY_030323 [Phlomoides rotata]
MTLMKRGRAAANVARCGLHRKKIKIKLERCRFLGSDAKVKLLRDIWKRNCRKWTNRKSFPENLVHIFGTQLSQPPHAARPKERGAGRMRDLLCSTSSHW